MYSKTQGAYAPFKNAAQGAACYRLPAATSRKAGGFYSTNSALTDSALEMRSMVSPNNDAQDNWRIFLQALPSSDSGMVSVTTSSSSSDSLMRLMAPPDRTGCVQ